MCIVVVTVPELAIDAAKASAVKTFKQSYARHIMPANPCRQKLLCMTGLNRACTAAGEYPQLYQPTDNREFTGAAA